MESDEAQEQLEIVRRAGAAPYLHHPPTPWWYAPAVGAWVAGMIGTFVWWRENAVLFVGVLVVLIVLEFVFLAWMRRRHGALPMPGRGTPPGEIAAVWRGYLLALPGLVLVVALTWWLAGVIAAAGIAFVLVTAGIAVYERRYALAADRARSRLA